MSNILSFKKWKSLFEFDDFDPKGEYDTDKTLGFETGGVDSGKVLTGGKNGDWAGSMQRALAFAKVAEEFAGRDVVTSQKRSRSSTANGFISDHYKGQENSYAVDIAASGAEGDRILNHLMKWVGIPAYKGGSWLNFIRDGYRYQIGWKVPDHYDHIHVGVRYLGPNAKDTDEGVLSRTSETPSGRLLPDAIGKVKDLLKKRAKGSSYDYPFKNPEEMDYDEKDYYEAVKRKERWDKAQEYKKYLEELRKKKEQ